MFDKSENCVKFFLNLSINLLPTKNVPGNLSCFGPADVMFYTDPDQAIFGNANPDPESD